MLHEDLLQSRVVTPVPVWVLSCAPALAGTHAEGVSRSLVKPFSLSWAFVGSLLLQGGASASVTAALALEWVVAA